jgi:hypothetical protein
MPLEPQDWSVVIAGYWNRAILTPFGIASRLFGLEPGKETSIEVDVPIDAIAPHRVTYDGLTVIVSPGRLLIEPRKKTFPELRRAMQVAVLALTNLPETPLIAVGINVKYRSAAPPSALLDLLRDHWDDDLADFQFRIEGRSLGRSLSWRRGTINATLSESEGVFLVDFNIERRSPQVADHKEWLSVDISEVETVVSRVMFDTMKVMPEDVSDGQQ